MSHPSSVKFVDLPGQYEDIREDILASIRDIVERGAFVGGPAVADFETKLAEFCGVQHAIGVSDGTAALKLSFLAAGLQPGDRVIVPTNSFIASANGVVHAGGVPVLVDCDPETYLIDLDQVEDALKRTAAKFVLPVHLYGNPCDMAAIVELAERHRAQVVEDNAQALGAKVQGKCTGAFGVAAGVSFYPAKNLGAFGQGGAVLTNDAAVAQRVRMYAEQGQGSQRYYHEVVGYNDRLHSIQACVLSHMLDKLDGFNKARAAAARIYAENLPKDRLQRTTPGATHVHHLFEFRCDDQPEREQIAEWLRERNIGCGYHYPVPIHKQQAYAEFNDLQFPVAERLAETLLSLPMHPLLSRQEVEYVSEQVSAACQQASRAA